MTWEEYMESLRTKDSDKMAATVLSLARDANLSALVNVWSTLSLEFEIPDFPLPKKTSLAWQGLWRTIDLSDVAAQVSQASGMSYAASKGALETAIRLKIVLPDGSVVPAAQNWIKLEAKAMVDKKKGSKRPKETGQSE